MHLFRRITLKSFYYRSKSVIPFFAAVFLFTACATQPRMHEQPSPPPQAAKQETRKYVVAKVNGVALYSDMLSPIVGRLTSRISDTAHPATPESVRKIALDELVLQELAVQEATRRGLKVNDMQIDKAMDKVIRNLGHEAGYQKYLKEHDLTPSDVRDQVRRIFLMQLIVKQDVIDKVSISDEDMRKEYDSRKKEFVVPASGDTPERQMTYEEAKPEIAKKLKTIEIMKRFQVWSDDLRKNATIEIMDDAAQKEPDKK